MNARLSRMLDALHAADGPLSYSPQHARFLREAVRELSIGDPVTAPKLRRLAESAHLDWPSAETLIETISERGSAGELRGLLGLSLNDYPHKLDVGDRQLSTWCALDALFLPSLLQKDAIVLAQTPILRARVRLELDAHGTVHRGIPTAPLVSIRVFDPSAETLGGSSAIQASFCHHVFFFASLGEYEQWATERDDTVVLSLDEAVQFALELVSPLFRGDSAAG